MALKDVHVHTWKPVPLEPHTARAVKDAEGKRLPSRGPRTGQCPGQHEPQAIPGLYEQKGQSQGQSNADERGHRQGTSVARRSCKRPGT